MSGNTARLLRCPGVSIDKELHKQFTKSWSSAIPKRGSKGFRSDLTADDILSAAKKVYEGHPQYYSAIQKTLSRLQ